MKDVIIYKTTRPDYWVGEISITILGRECEKEDIDKIINKIKLSFAGDRNYIVSRAGPEL